jgi:hypothetical protein
MLRWKKPLLAFFVISSISLFRISAGWTSPISVTESSAQAWVWVKPTDQSRLIGDLRSYAAANSLRISVSEVPAPWKMIGITMLTPAGNQISFINATAREEFSVSITVFSRSEDWKSRWIRFRAYVRARYKWQDIP